MPENPSNSKPLAETVLMDPQAPAAAVAQVDIGYQRLLTNYAYLVRTQEIYYPMAYRFTRKLGSGRQGVVFQASRQGARGCVTQHAIKIHDPSIYPNTEKYWTDMGRIASQISKLHKISSPQLVSRDIYEEVNGIGFTQMEVVEGIDVHRLIHGNHFELVKKRSSRDEVAHFGDVVFNERGIQPGVALYIMRQGLRGLEALHNAGFVHSDIKPANMMVDRLGIVKLVDYGRAVMIDERNTFLLGTPLFMAPELHRREAATVQSDIYSIGLVGLELLRGESLVDDTGMDEREMLAFKLDLVDRLPELLPEAVLENEPLLDMFRKLLHPDPAQRYATAAEAESGSDGLSLIHKQLTIAGKDTEYDRELEHYVRKVIGEDASGGGKVEAFIG